MQTATENLVKPYPSQADCGTINKAIVKLSEAKQSPSSGDYSAKLREANILINNLWKAENL